MNRNILVLCLLFCLTKWNAQNREIDSLLKVLSDQKCSPPNNISGDTNTAKALYGLGWDLCRIGKYDSSLLYCEAGLLLSRKLNFKTGIAASIGNMGTVYNEKGQSAKALECHFESLKMAQEQGNKIQQSISLNNIGVIYFHLMELDKAMKYYLQAYSIDEISGNKRGMATRLGNLGNVYFSKQNYGEALHYYFKALKLREELGIKRLISSTLGNIATTYMNQGDSAIARNNEDFARKVKYPAAIVYYERSMKLAQEIKDRNGLCIIYGNLGTLRKQVGDEMGSLQFYYKALALSTEIGALEHRCGIYRELSTLYEGSIILLPDSSVSKKLNREEMLRRALYYRKRYMSLKDSLLNEETKKELAVKEMNYEFGIKELAMIEKQEKERVIAEEKSTRQKIILFATIAVLLIIGIFTIFILRTLNYTRRQKLIIEDKQKEILDSIHYAKRIQTHLLPTASKIQSDLTRLKEKKG